jgi:hypothetical protein
MNSHTEANNSRINSVINEKKLVSWGTSRLLVAVRPGVTGNVRYLNTSSNKAFTQRGPWLFGLLNSQADLLLFFYKQVKPRNFSFYEVELIVRP